MINDVKARRMLRKKQSVSCYRPSLDEGTFQACLAYLPF